MCYLANGETEFVDQRNCARTLLPVKVDPDN